MSLCILNKFTVNTNGGNLIRTSYSETRRDYLIIKLVIVANEPAERRREAGEAAAL